MGQRADLVVVTSEREPELYYTHWRANRLDCDLFWGPDEALRFARAQQSRSGRALLDEGWAEGGAIIDTVRRELLWFGGEGVRWDVPLRRMHLCVMRELWQGWSVRWADEGVADMARSLGVPLESVLVSAEDAIDRRGDYVLEPPAEPESVLGVLSLRRASGALGFFALDTFFDDLASIGPRFAAALSPAALDGRLDDQLDYGARFRSFPSGGIHVDEARRSVEVWTASWAEDFDRRLRAAWPGWSVVWRGGRFESQLELCEGRLVFPARSEQALIDEVRAVVTRRACEGVLGRLEEALERVRRAEAAPFSRSPP